MFCACMRNTIFFDRCFHRRCLLWGRWLGLLLWRQGPFDRSRLPRSLWPFGLMFFCFFFAPPIHIHTIISWFPHLSVSGERFFIYWWGSWSQLVPELGLVLINVTFLNLVGNLVTQNVKNTCTDKHLHSNSCRCILLGPTIHTTLLNQLRNINTTSPRSLGGILLRWERVLMSITN